MKFCEEMKLVAPLVPCHRRHHHHQPTNRLRGATITQQRCNMPGGIDRNKRDGHMKTARIDIIKEIN